MIFKIDLEKAYNHMECDFVDYLLLRFDFGGRWKQWRREFITFSFSLCQLMVLSLLVKPSRVLWQVDTIFPFLFAIVTEDWSLD